MHGYTWCCCLCSSTMTFDTCVIAVRARCTVFDQQYTYYVQLSIRTRVAPLHDTGGFTLRRPMETGRSNLLREHCHITHSRTRGSGGANCQVQNLHVNIAAQSAVIGEMVVKRFDLGAGQDFRAKWRQRWTCSLEVGVWMGTGIWPVSRPAPGGNQTINIVWCIG